MLLGNQQNIICVIVVALGKQMALILEQNQGRQFSTESTVSCLRDPVWGLAYRDTKKETT